MSEGQEHLASLTEDHRGREQAQCPDGVFSAGRFLGIEVGLHTTLLVLLALVAVFEFLLTRSPGRTSLFLLALGALFSFVLLHELAHALMARRFGIQTRRIVLWPIGGMAQLERELDDPHQELLVALAGPAVNLGLAVLFLVGLGLAQAFGFGRPGPVADALFFGFAVNGLLAFINLVPALPMDGGRILRAWIARRTGPERATVLAARISQALAVVAGLLSLVVNPFLIFLALFVWVGARSEAAAVLCKRELARVTPAGDLRRTGH